MKILDDNIEVDRGKTPLISSSFSVGGNEFDSSEFSEIIEIQPTRIWKQTKPELRNRHDLNNFEWIYKIKKKPLWSIGEAVNEILEIFWLKRQKIVSYSEKNKLSISIGCSIYIDDPMEDSNPELCLYPDLIQKMADLKADFGMFIY
jgi:hypothetical protein